MSVILSVCLCSGYGDHRDRHVLTHSFPTRRPSDLSAGTGDWHIGHPPDARALAKAKAEGIDIAHYRARQVTPDDFHRFSHIVALDTQNLSDLEALRPAGGPAKLALLMDYVAGREGEAVPDPYHGGPEEFDQVWQLVDDAAGHLAERIAIDDRID